MKRFIGFMLLGLAVSAASAGVTIVDPAWQPATLYYQDSGLTPDVISFGFDGALYAGNDIFDTPTAVSVYRITAPLTGGAYGDPLIDPDAVVQLADGSLYVGGGFEVWQVPAGGVGPNTLVTNAFTSGSRPDDFVLAPNGDVLANDGDRIVRVNPDGTLTNVVTNISNAGGMDIGADGYLYFTNYGRTGISRVLYDPLGAPVDATTLAAFISGFNGIDDVDVISDGRILFGDRTAGTGANDTLYFGQLDGSTSAFALVPKIISTTNNHYFRAIEGPDGAIYIADGQAGESAIYRTIPEPTSLLLLVAGALLARRRS